jgi:hypothetical protein
MATMNRNASAIRSIRPSQLKYNFRYRRRRENLKKAGVRCYQTGASVGSLLVALFVGFFVGFGAREYISRRRRAAARRKFREDHPELRTD